MVKPIIIDAHEDIAWNKLALDRDFFEGVSAKRKREGTSPAHGEGTALVGFPELLAGNVRVVFGTIFVAPERPDRSPRGKTYSSPQEAYEQGMEQLAYYAMLATDPRVSLITTRQELDRVLVSNGEPHVGIVILMEGADPIVTPAQVPEWYQAGVRIVGTSWGQTRYAGGTRAPGGLSPSGRELLPEMERAGLILDTSHMAEQSFYETLEIFHGAVIASHSNCRAFVDTDRQLSDAMIRSLVERDGVIGSVIYNRFVKVDWDTSALKDTVSLTDVMEHMLHICDIAGDASHIGIGTDFDGGFGRESVPREIDTIADLQKLGDVLTMRFSDEEIAGILAGNWVRLLRRALP